MTTRGFGDWAVEVEDKCCNDKCNQGRNCVMKDRPMFDNDPAASLFISAVMVAATAVLALIFIGVWA